MRGELAQSAIFMGIDAGARQRRPPDPAPQIGTTNLHCARYNGQRGTARRRLNGGSRRAAVFGAIGDVRIEANFSPRAFYFRRRPSRPVDGRAPFPLPGRELARGAAAGRDAR